MVAYLIYHVSAALYSCVVICSFTLVHKLNESMLLVNLDCISLVICAHMHSKEFVLLQFGNLLVYHKKFLNLPAE